MLTDTCRLASDSQVSHLLPPSESLQLGSAAGVERLAAQCSGMAKLGQLLLIAVHRFDVDADADADAVAIEAIVCDLALVRPLSANKAGKQERRLTG